MAEPMVLTEGEAVEPRPQMSRAAALAFESGGDPQACARALAVLREAGARATIFLDGLWASRNPTLVQAIAADGHELGNHGYSHPDMTELSDGDVAEELERTESVAQQLVGATTRPWFRPPFQRMDDRVRRVAEDLGFRCIVRDALDGAHYVGSSTRDRIAALSLARAFPGMVLTYHLQNGNTAAALPEVLAALRDRGIAVGPISALPAPPPERIALHEDFDGLTVAPGYLRMQRSAAPLQMVNLLSMGADTTAPVDRLILIDPEADVGLLVFDGKGRLPLPAAREARQLSCLTGESVLEIHDDEGPYCTAHLTPGDSLSVPAGAEVIVRPANGRRAILLMVGNGSRATEEHTLR